ncbi:MAG: hypothetical protein HKL87_04030 [Acidimicrobiaceae bacterium]|nr:hypothetical protein [Acidimicrobiaceae bacterium]
MKRRTLDFLLTSLGALLSVGLLATGSLLMWGYSFASSTVRNQLSAQKIYFPPKGSSALAPSDIGPYLNQYAGQQMLNGAQAQAYADHFIAVHLKEIGGGLTYSQLSTKALAQPNNATLAAQVDTVFKGDTLRSMLLDAYAFWTFGQIAWWSAWAAYLGALFMVLLTALGWRHYRRVDDTVTL